MPKARKSKGKKSAERVVIFDTTLRDGEQSPGASLNIKEKVEVAQALGKLGVDVIEAGFPIASPGDFEAVKAVAEELEGRTSVCALARCLEKDIRRAAAAVKNARRARIHVFLSTSEIHLKHQLRKTRREVVAQAIASVELARTFCRDVEFSPMDASRTEPAFLAEVVEATIAAGAGTVNIPDTVGYAVPSEFGALIRYLMDHVPNIKKTVISVHCHNDLGLAVANSLAAVAAGARQIECTINGLGERAGNTALEEAVMGLRTRPDFFKRLRTNVDTKKLVPTSRLVSNLTGLRVQRNKAVVGENAFAHESGIHQDGILKNEKTYEIMRAQDVGFTARQMVLGKHSGRHAFRQRLRAMGYALGPREFEVAFERFKELADKKKAVYDGDLEAIAESELGEAPKVYEIDALHVTSGTNVIPTATVRLRHKGKVSQDAATGDGPVDAATRAIDRLTGRGGKLLDYQLRAVTHGKDAMGEVSVGVDFGGTVVHGRAVSTDIVEASAVAYLDAVNRAEARRLPRGRALGRKVKRTPTKKAPGKKSKKRGARSR